MKGLLKPGVLAFGVHRRMYMDYISPVLITGSMCSGA